MKKIKLLHILTELQLTNGITSYVMNHYQRLDHDKFQVDFLIVKTADQKYIDMIEKHQDRIIQAPRLSMKNYAKFVKHAKTLFTENNYDIVHSHEFNWGMPYLVEAKKKGIAVRIFHAHATQSSPSLVKKIRNALLIPKTIHAATDLWSCSEVAGKFFFKDKPFYLSHNAIDYERFLFNQEYRDDIRSILNLEKDIKLIGFFGRFEAQKNPMQTLDVFKELLILRKDVHLLMVGGGSLEPKLLEFISENNMDQFVTMFSPRRDIYKFYSAIDLFMLPSLYEGLPVVGVEALFSNLKQVYSTNITRELNLIDSITYLPLDLSVDMWARKVSQLLDQKSERVLKSSDKLNIYKIDYQAKMVEEKYLSFFKGA
ncbi:glycosyltransferase [Acholeplasma equirhinis]|uniref:glycosyltransferase n=1 Tax=Acholeplasma equirhinis TaxID=555393 RepID=UPI00197AF55D|nr:glycosyltransferase [Acholeplasma equirhinis]MBN3489997.1 glycosyltransferase [Acholeplasma equirhinis]